MLKLLVVLKILTFLSQLFGYVEKRLDVTNWTTNTQFFIRKPFFCLSLNFLNIMIEMQRFLRYNFLTFVSLFSLIVYLVRFDNKNKRHFLTFILTQKKPVYKNKQPTQRSISIF